MISVQEAWKFIKETHMGFGMEHIPLDQAVGRILREPIAADRDFPPYNRVMMDGIAISYNGWESGNRSFVLQDIQLAGAEQMELAQNSNCIEVMTGSVCPVKADTVIRYEDLEIDRSSDPVRVFVKTDDIFPNQNIHYQGSDRKAKDTLVETGVKLSAAEIAVAATVGMTQVAVTIIPKIAILSTGDELVDIDEVPAPHQIRRSNSYMLQAALLSMGIEATPYHLPDNPEIIERNLDKLLSEHEIIVLTGGVSKGKADYIPEILVKLGLEKKFHKVSQRPGKPFWFGSNLTHGKVVFALPGNPVSSFVGFHRYVKPWLTEQMGVKGPPIRNAQLSEAFAFLPDLTYFLLVETYSDEEGKLIARPIPGGGSGDLANLIRCDGFLELPSERSHFDRGEVFPFYSYRI